MAARKHIHGHGTKQHHLPKNYCFVCGKDNPLGMKMKFYLDERRKRFVSRFRLAKHFIGPPAHSHGGIIATVLDEAMGKVNKLRSVIALTRVMEVHYLKPVPLGKPLIVESREKRVHGRRHINVAEIRNLKGEVLARGEATFVKIDPVKMFARFVGNRRALAPFLRREPRQR